MGLRVGVGVGGSVGYDGVGQLECDACDAGMVLWGRVGWADGCSLGYDGVGQDRNVMQGGCCGVVVAVLGMMGGGGGGGWV